MTKIKRIVDVQIPTKSNDLYNCFDLYIPEDVYVILYPQTFLTIPLGIVLESDTNAIGELTMRFSASKKGLMMPNGIGIISPDPHRELQLLLFNSSTAPKHVETGDSICQLLIRNDDHIITE